MRKLVALLVLLILPLQLAFAAGAEYCETEKADAGHHFGHHEHDAKSKSSPGKSTGGDSGCAYCDLGCTYCSGASSGLGVHALPSRVTAHEHPLLRGIAPSTVERPPRTALA